LAAAPPPAAEGEAPAVFNPRMRACLSCGTLNPINSATCSGCKAPFANAVAPDPTEYYAATMIRNRKGRAESFGAWLCRNTAAWIFLVFGGALLAMASELLVWGRNYGTGYAILLAPAVCLLMGLVMLEIPGKLLKLLRRPSPNVAPAEPEPAPSQAGRHGLAHHLLAALCGAAVAAGLYAAGLWLGFAAMMLLLAAAWIGCMLVWLLRDLLFHRLPADEEE
jgi:hypothetical protein